MRRTAQAGLPLVVFEEMQQTALRRSNRRRA